MKFNDMVKQKRYNIKKSVMTIGNYDYYPHTDDYDEEYYSHEFAEGDEIRVYADGDGWHVEVYIDYELVEEFEVESLGDSEFESAVYCIRDRIAYDVMINQLGDTLEINGFTFDSMKGDGHEYGTGYEETCYYYSEHGGGHYDGSDRFIAIFPSLSDDDKSIDGISDINFYNKDCKGSMIGDHWGSCSLSELESKVIEGMRVFEFIENDEDDDEEMPETITLAGYTLKWGYWKDMTADHYEYNDGNFDIVVYKGEDVGDMGGWFFQITNTTDYDFEEFYVDDLNDSKIEQTIREFMGRYDKPKEKSTTERISDMTSQYGQTITLGNLVFTPMSTGDQSGYIGYECVLRGVFITLFPPKVNEEEFDEWEIYVDGDATTLGPTLNVSDVRDVIIEKVPDEIDHLEEDWGDGWDSFWESRRY